MISIKIQIQKVTTIIIQSIVFFFGLCALSSGTPYYVDNAAIGANNGSSWNDAWKSFADINWGSINPGDIVYISGGSSGKTYHELLNLPNLLDGARGNEITITVGIDSGHNGQVTIDGDLTRRCVELSNNDYVIVGGNTSNYMRCIKATGSGSIYARNGSNFTIQYWEFPNYNTRGVVFIEKNAANFTIKYITGNNIASSSQNDFIVIQTGGPYEITNFIIEHIAWRDDNTKKNPHVDCMQLGTPNYTVSNGTLRYNHCIQNNTKIKNSQGIFADNFKGTWYVHNNLLEYNTGVPLKFKKSDSGAKVYLFNNTIIKKGDSDRNMALVSGKDTVVKNNIFYRKDSQASALSFYDTLRDIREQVDYNIYYVNGTSSRIVSYGDSNISWSEWTSEPYNADANGYNKKPSLQSEANGDFRLNADSIGVDEGTDLTSYGINKDIDGISRPQGSSFDIGAYELWNGD